MVGFDFDGFQKFAVFSAFGGIVHILRGRAGIGEAGAGRGVLGPLAGAVLADEFHGVDFVPSRHAGGVEVDFDAV